MGYAGGKAFPIRLANDLSKGLYLKIFFYINRKDVYQIGCLLCNFIYSTSFCLIIQIFYSRS